MFFLLCAVLPCLQILQSHGLIEFFMTAIPPFFFPVAACTCPLLDSCDAWPGRCHKISQDMISCFGSFTALSAAQVHVIQPYDVTSHCVIWFHTLYYGTPRVDDTRLAHSSAFSFIWFQRPMASSRELVYFYLAILSVLNGIPWPVSMSLFGFVGTLITAWLSAK